MLSLIFKDLMFLPIISAHVGQLLTFLSVFLAIFFGVFLFWRAGRRELVDSQLLFDVVTFFGLGALLAGRLVDFFVRWDFYEWSIRRLVFFNVYSGFDIWGAMLGGVSLVWLYLRQKRASFWEIFDMAASGMAFCTFTYLFFKSLQMGLGANYKVFVAWLYTTSYLILFWSIKRFEKQKKHRGFFVCFFLFFSSVLNITFIILKSGINFTNYWWPLSFSLVILVVSAFSWYLLSKRKIIRDIETFFGAILLTTFKLRRVITSVREADNSARVIILSPLFLVKGLYYLVKYMGREIYLSFVDLAHAFGVGK